MNKKLILLFLTLSISLNIQLMSEPSDAFDFVRNESQIKQICFSSWTANNPDICESCDAITQGLQMAFEKQSLIAELEEVNRAKVKRIFFGPYAKVLAIRSAKKKIGIHQEKIENFFQAEVIPSVKHLLTFVEPEQHEQEIGLITDALNNAEKNILPDL